MPLVRVRLFDKNNTALKSHIADQTDIALSPINKMLVSELSFHQFQI